MWTPAHDGLIEKLAITQHIRKAGRYFVISEDDFNRLFREAGQSTAQAITSSQKEKTASVQDRRRIKLKEKLMNKYAISNVAIRSTLLSRLNKAIRGIRAGNVAVTTNPGALNILKAEIERPGPIAKSIVSKIRAITQRFK